jgi:hypothetical protein
MKKHSVAVFTALSAASLMALGLVALAPPASAQCAQAGCPGGGGQGPGGGITVACDGTTAECTAGEYGLITLAGDSSKGGSDYVNLPPLPCEWYPIGDLTQGAEIIQDTAELVEHTPNPDQQALLQELENDLQEAAALEAEHPPPQGNWYVDSPNPAVPAAESANCGDTQLFAWVANGAAAPGVPAIPPRDLAIYALDHMVLPQPKVVISPAAKGYVNFATYVWTKWPNGRLTGTRAHEVTATLAATGQSVTVWAQPKVTISPTKWGTVYDSCPPPSYSTKFQPGHVPAVEGGAPDCGVLWTSTTFDTTVTATITWTVTWYEGGPAGPAGRHLATIHTTGGSGLMPIDAIEAIN